MYLFMYLFGCIIAGESPSIEWSSCTKEIWQQNLEANVGKCMENLPENLHDDAMTCGNFFIDEGVYYIIYMSTSDISYSNIDCLHNGHITPIVECFCKP